jgi:protease I
MPRVVIPLPSTDFDPTEAAVPWMILNAKNIDVVFATPDAKPAKADPIVLTGVDFGIWSPILRAGKTACDAYEDMRQSRSFTHPIRWDDIDQMSFDGIILPGGHAPGMKVFLESTTLQKVVADFFQHSKIVGAICHGVVLVARSTDASGRSLLNDRRATALLRSQELVAWGLTCLWLGNYYRTYNETVQAEVSRHLGNTGHFESGPIPLRRDSVHDLDSGFVVEDGNLITARWPGDAHRFGEVLARRLLGN